MAYCTVEDVTDLLPKNISAKIIDPKNPQKPISEADITEYIDRAQGLINAVLSVLYVTPIRKIVVVDPSDGTTETEQYPDPITMMTSAFTCYLIYPKLYAENANPNQLPEYAKEMRDLANKYMNGILSGAMILKGQRPIARRNVRPESMDTIKLPVPFKEFDISKMG